MAPSRDIKALLRKVRRLHIQSKKAAMEYMAGQYHSAFKGRGIEFHEVRPYLTGDDTGRIDWNVTARTGLLHVKNFVEEREQCVIFLVDTSSSLGFGSKANLKSETVAEVCALLAFSAVTNRDRVGLILFSDHVEKYVPPRRGTGHCLRLIRELLVLQPERRLTGIQSALSYLEGVRKKRAIVFLISDFLDAGYMDGLRPVAAKHDLIAVKVYDPREHTFEGKCGIRLRDLETQVSMDVDLGSRKAGEHYAQKAKEDREEVKSALAAQGVDLLEVSTQASCAPMLRTFFTKRLGRRAYP
jgi:uncharacterized protein (DUF58 family)